MLKYHNSLTTKTKFFNSYGGQISCGQSSCFIHVTDIQNINWLNMDVLSKQNILYFGDIAHLLKYYPMKTSRNGFILFNYLNHGSI